ncbi:MAG: DUF5686 and carboxypeptidase regulatory-like domain-containing protein [Chitinophagaceae bacterium]
MRLLFLITLLITNVSIGLAQLTVSGTITDKDGNPVSYASVIAAGTSLGTTANTKGFYSLHLPEGNYEIICKRLGYEQKSTKITLQKNANLNFVLAPQAYVLNDVMVQNKAEDPAYGIIRKAIEQKSFYNDQLKKFTCNVYLKGQLQLKDYPKKFLGETVDFEDGDTSKRKMIFLSETIAEYAKENKEVKIKVLSTKVSGQSEGFGFSNPQILSFYDNFVNIGTSLNPRGFVSPLHDNAFQYYKFKFRGTYYENGKEVNHIEVIPKRKYEPLFSGFINISENDWRIESVQLQLVKAQQLQLLDTLKVEQIFTSNRNAPEIQQQVLSPVGNILGFKFFGSFVQVYNNFNFNPSFDKKFFGNTFISFTDSSNKKSLSYWDAARPIPLLPEEVKDYKKKDSLEQLRQDPKYLDSLDRISNKVTYSKIVLYGQRFYDRKTKSSLSFSPVLGTLSTFNSVEGYVLSTQITYEKEFANKSQLEIKPYFRYGLSNKQFNATLSGTYIYGKKGSTVISAEAGRNVFQFNNANPISEIGNSIASLWWARNYMKIYQAGFAHVNFYKQLNGGFRVVANLKYQDRMPLENSTDATFYRDKTRKYTPNYPTEIQNENIEKHQALSASVGFIWNPGTKYAEFPNRRVMLRSTYPTFRLTLTKGINGILGSDVDYLKWRASVSDDMNLKLAGRFSYLVAAGGFLNDKKVYTPDYQHFLGNQTILANNTLGAFHALQYYRFSNTQNFYTQAHFEHHLNGFLTNKIPGFKKLNWFLVTGANALWINKENRYLETFVGLENILKVIRIDAVWGFNGDGTTTNGIRLHLPIINNNPR